MKNMRKRITMLMLAVIMLLGSSVMLGSSNITQAADNSDGIKLNADSGTKTMYYIDVPLSGEVLYMHTAPGKTKTLGNQAGLMKDFANKLDGTTQTFVFVYDSVSINGYPPFTSYNIKIKAERVSVFATYLIKITFQDNAEINIRSEYYQYLQNADLSKVVATLFYESHGERLVNAANSGYWTHNSSKGFIQNYSGIKLRQREVPADYDPIKEEGQLPDNGGIATNPAAEKADKNWLLNAIADLFGITVKQLKNGFSWFMRILLGGIVFYFVFSFIALLIKSGKK